MYFFTLVDKFKSLDIYRKLPSDFVQPTYSGALCKLFYFNKNKIYNFSILNQCNSYVFIIIE